MYFLKVNATYRILEPLRKNFCSALESALQAFDNIIVLCLRRYLTLLSWLLRSGDW